MLLVCMEPTYKRERYPVYSAKQSFLPQHVWPLLLSHAQENHLLLLKKSFLKHSLICRIVRTLAIFYPVYVCMSVIFRYCWWKVLQIRHNYWALMRSQLCHRKDGMTYSLSFLGTDSRMVVNEPGFVYVGTGPIAGVMTQNMWQDHKQQAFVQIYFLTL